MTVKQWHGTDNELLALRVAVQNHCSCEEGGKGKTCDAHAMLLNQTVLDHLVFVYRSRQSFVEQEFAGTAAA